MTASTELLPSAKLKVSLARLWTLTVYFTPTQHDTESSSAAHNVQGGVFSAANLR